MPVCYECSGLSCKLDLSELPTCNASKYCFTKTEVNYLAEHGGQQVLDFERGCEHHRSDLQFSGCEIYHRSKPESLPDLHHPCCDTDRCNSLPFKKFQLDNPFIEPMPSHHLAMYIIGFVILVGAITSVISLIYKRRKSNKNNNDDYELGTMDGNMGYEFSYEFEDSPKKGKKKKKKALELANDNEEAEDFDISSGAVHHSMQQRTLYKDVVLGQKIGHGRYGLVYKAKWKSDDVAVKTFMAREYASYEQEKQIYESMSMTMSEYILNFLAIDLSPGEYTEHWILTEYCPLGSLFDFLSRHTLTLENAKLIVNSLLSGFAYLHKDMFRSSKKPQIAHRDIKSKNILMRTPTLCVIADFGLAVTYHNGGNLRVPVNYKVGTKRYMAPEILNSTFNNNRFSSYLQSDIYSISLVLWEVIHRVEHLPTIAAKPFSVAYEGMVPPDPSFDDMLEVVFTQNQRPEINPALREDDFLKTMIIMIGEAWATKSSSRPSIVNMKGRIEGFFS